MRLFQPEFRAEYAETIMKNGKPSLLYDIRYFLNDQKAYLRHPAAVAYGRRMAWLLNSESISLGAFNSLYVNLSRSLSDGEISISNRGTDWWYLSIDVGVASFSESSTDALESVQEATVAALLEVCPEARDLIIWADKTARKHAEDIRFLVKSNNFKRYVFNVATTIPDNLDNTNLFVSVLDKQTGNEVELRPLAFGTYMLAFDDAEFLRLKDVDIEVLETGKLNADWSDKFQTGRTNIRPRKIGYSSPYYTKLIRRQS